MFIVLDGAGSALGPYIMSVEETYTAAAGLSQLGNTCLCIASRISTVPLDYKWLNIPMPPMEAAYSTFYRIYQHGERSDLTNNTLEELDFHPLSITLITRVAHHNE
jgi:hypothetical protein